MKIAKAGILEQRDASIKPAPYSPKISLGPDIAEHVLEVASRASLGFHTAALVRLANGVVCAFTEWYPAAHMPCNGGEATSLYEVAMCGGPALPAHEFQLEIRGAHTMEQIRAIRRIRGILPELEKVEVTDNAVHLHHAKRRTCISDRDRKAIVVNCATAFGPLSIEFTPSGRPLSEEVVLGDLDRLALRKLATMAWADARQSGSGRLKRLTHDESLHRHVQTALFDIPESSATVIEQGPKMGRAKTTTHWRIEDRWLVSVVSSRFGGRAWHDSARAAVLQCPVPLESVRVLPRAQELLITALVSENHVATLSKQHKPNELPFAIRLSAVRNDDFVTRSLFHELPTTWNFRGIRMSPCDTKLVLDADPPGVPTLPPEVKARIEQRIRRSIFYQHNRFQPVSFDDPHVRKILDVLPFSTVVRSVERCVSTGELKIHTAHKISDRTLQRYSASPASNSVPSVLAPYVIERPVHALRRNTMTPGKLPRVSDENIRSLIAIGGAMDTIGGSLLLLGNILLDYGVFPKNSKVTEPFSEEARLWLQRAQAALISHAHLDHVGNALALNSRGIPVLMHHATALVSWPLLREQMRATSQFPHYALERFYESVCPVPYGYPVRLSETLTARLIEAGHIAGSSMIVIDHMGKNGRWRAMYTGDLQYDEAINHHRIYPSAAQMRDVDALIIEATNGMKPIPERAVLERQLIDRIKESLARGGRVLLPAIASRAPELLTLLAQYRSELAVPIYVDGPAVRDSNQIHGYISKLHPELFRQRNRFEQGWYGVENGFFKEISRNREDQFFREQESRIVVMSGGMGFGAAERHIKAAKPQDTVIFTCFQAPGTAGHELLTRYQASLNADTPTTWDGPPILLERLSGHISGEKLLQFVKSTLKPQGTVVLVHGGNDEKVAVKAALTEQGHAGKIIIAQPGVEISL